MGDYRDFYLFPKEKMKSSSILVGVGEIGSLEFLHGCSDPKGILLFHLLLCWLTSFPRLYWSSKDS